MSFKKLISLIFISLLFCSCELLFKHEEFFEVCHQVEAHQLISYNSDNLIKDAFIGYDMSDYDLTYTMRSTGNYMEQQKDRKELVMKRYDI